jgi:hypothetical protein
MTMKPQIVSVDMKGTNNGAMDEAISRLNIMGAYKDLSTVVICPGFGTIPTKIVAAWWSLMFPPNGKVFRVFPLAMEVGEAFSQTIQNVLDHPELKKFKYILTLEHDNSPPQDGLVRLLMHAEAHPEFAAIGGLYWTKGPGGVAQIWGDPKSSDMNYRPQKPIPGQLVECRGVGMGFTLYRTKTFMDRRLRKPWFKTTSSKKEGCATQDLYFWGDAQKHGYRCAVACDVHVGHYDHEGKFGPPDTMW